MNTTIVKNERPQTILNGQQSHLSEEHRNKIIQIIQNNNQLSAIIAAERIIYHTLTDKQKDNGVNNIDIILEKLIEMFSEYFGKNNLKKLHENGLLKHYELLSKKIKYNYDENNQDNKYGTAIIGFILIGATLPKNDNKNKKINTYTKFDNVDINLTIQSLSENLLIHIGDDMINNLCTKIPNFQLYNI